LAIDLARECSIGVPFVTSVVVVTRRSSYGLGRGRSVGVFQLDQVEHLDTSRRVCIPGYSAVTIAAAQPKHFYASTARSGYQQRSGRAGSPWASREMAAAYARGLAVKADDPGVLFAGCGETTTGERGTCSAPKLRESWDLPSPPSPMPLCGALPRIPRRHRIVAFRLFRRVYSVDAGASGARSRANSARSGPQTAATRRHSSGSITTNDAPLFTLSRRPGRGISRTLALRHQRTLL
jgi:hypothetical protein